MLVDDYITLEKTCLMIHHESWIRIMNVESWMVNETLNWIVNETLNWMHDASDWIEQRHNVM